MGWYVSLFLALSVACFLYRIHSLKRELRGEQETRQAITNDYWQQYRECQHLRVVYDKASSENASLSRRFDLLKESEAREVAKAQEITEANQKHHDATILKVYEVLSETPVIRRLHANPDPIHFTG